MRITMLLENDAREGSGLAAEHGLSLHIEAAGRRILFDTGQSDAFARNAEALGIDLAAVDFAVISHGHYDHTGGLARFLELNDHAPVYLHRSAFEKRGAKDGRDIGMDVSLKDSPRLVFTDDELALGDGLDLLTCNAQERPFPSHSDGLYQFRDGLPLQDDFLHEQYLRIREGGKTVLVSGCSHKGILNIMHWMRPDVLIGGFHFMGLPCEGEGREALDRAAEALASYDAEYFTGHCTGRKQFQYLKEQLGNRLHHFAGGMSLEI
jgi:7,8-dihydropterin-6-yl-methyl-4-(beta-D-ribofuranosyl)aminobenzene 5'-phosphate synthase